MGKEDEKYRLALIGKKIPIITLDHKWHQMFTRVEKSRTIAEKENELNELLRNQGKCNNETKKIKKLKKKLMDEIVTLMEKQDDASEKKIEDNRRLINECNEKLREFQDELLDLETKISEKNTDLMLETMKTCYNTMHFNDSQIQEISKWIAQIRVELKKNVVRKQEMEIANQEIYSYMHSIFGSGIIDIFDMKYNPEEKNSIHIKEEKSEGK